MHPLVGTEEEMKFLAEMTHKVVNEVLGNNGIELDYKVGTMVEVPRAALVAGDWQSMQNSSLLVLMTLPS